MQTYGDMERAMGIALKEQEDRDKECISCPTCGSQWFTEVEAQRYLANHHLIAGQKVPNKPGTVPYQVLRCLQCEKLLEPRIIHNTRDIAGDDYDHFLDTLEGKFDKRPKEENKEVQLIAELNAKLADLEAELATLKATKKPNKNSKKESKDEVSSQG